MNMQQLKEKVSQLDEKTKQQILSIHSEEEAYNLSKTLGFTGSREDFSKKLDELHEQNMQFTAKEIKDIFNSPLNEEEQPDSSWLFLLLLIG